MKAPVGPPICTLLPPKAETITPATMAVIIPFSGLTPEAIAKAMASGKATIPTIRPAIRSELKVFLLYFFNVETKIGLNSNAFILFVLHCYSEYNEMQRYDKLSTNQNKL